MKIIVTWLHGGQTKTYEADDWEIQDGLLWLKWPWDSSRPAVCIPLVNVQVLLIGAREPEGPVGM